VPARRLSRTSRIGSLSRRISRSVDEPTAPATTSCDQRQRTKDGMTLSEARQAPVVQADEGASSRLRTLLVVAILTFAASIALIMQWFTAWSFVTWEASDLSVYRQAGEVIASGGPLYDVRFVPGFWTYPPFGGLVMVPLTLVPLDVLFPLSYLVNAVGLAVVIALTGRPLLHRAPDAAGRVLMVVGLTLLALTLTPVAEVLALGQIGVLLMVACCLDLLVVGQRFPRAQGVLVGIATAVKLTPGIFVLHWLVTRQYRAALTALGTTAGCWLLAAVVLRQDTATYVERLLLFRTNDQIDGYGGSVMNQSWRGLVDGLPSPASSLLWLALAAITLLLGLQGAARACRVGRPAAAVGILGLASVLVTPIAWHHHAVWVVPAVLALVDDGRHRIRLAGATLITVLLMIPARLEGPLADRYTLLYVVLLGWLLVIVRQEAALVGRRLSQPLDRF
jgi:alpha-1,2-mannosyltransferase